MYTPTNFVQAQEVIGNYQEVLREREEQIDSLMSACVFHLRETLSYDVTAFPPSLEHTVCSFDGHMLWWFGNYHGDEGAYDRVGYVPLRQFAFDGAKLPRNCLGDPMPVVCWRGLLWIPHVHYQGRACDDTEQIVEIDAQVYNCGRMEPYESPQLPELMAPAQAGGA